MKIAAALIPRATSSPSTPQTAECLYCGSTRLNPKFNGVRDRLAYVPGERAFISCQECGSLALSLMPGVDDIPGFYPPVYSFTLESQGRGWFKRLLSRAEYHLYFRPQYAAQARHVLRTCGWKTGQGKALLDVGCGRGLRLLEFRKLGFEVHGMDVLPDVVRYLNDELSIPTKCADVARLRHLYAENSFDVVTAFQLVEHVPHVDSLLDDCARIVRPGGWVVLATPLADSLQARLFGKRWINVTEAPRHVSLATKAGLRAAFSRAGLEAGSIVPDTVTNCAGLVGLSLFSGGAMSHAFAQGAVISLLKRFAGAAVSAAALPASLIANHVIGRPSVGIAFARKPL
jgi:SAM-dependent methyltransferase